eukprot:m.473649 g.473649  ORF g.473649 m.473649 type:complete len:373 (-) comp57128_c0_seq7:3065-4183(-)
MVACITLPTVLFFYRFSFSPSFFSPNQARERNPTTRTTATQQEHSAMATADTIGEAVGAITMFGELLMMARSEVVQGWDLPTFNRLIKWAQLISATSARLKLAKPDISAAVLADCQRVHPWIGLDLLDEGLAFVLFSLLRNPYLPPQLLAVVLDHLELHPAHDVQQTISSHIAREHAFRALPHASASALNLFCVGRSLFDSLSRLSDEGKQHDQRANLCLLLEHSPSGAMFCLGALHEASERFPSACEEQEECVRLLNILEARNDEDLCMRLLDLPQALWLSLCRTFVRVFLLTVTTAMNLLVDHHTSAALKGQARVLFPALRQLASIHVHACHFVEVALNAHVANCKLHPAFTIQSDCAVAVGYVSSLFRS